MLKKLFLTLIAFIFCFSLISAPVSAANGKGVHRFCDGRSEEDDAKGGRFLGLYAWDCGVNIDNVENEAELTGVAIGIAANILVDIIVISAYLVIAYTIYGGYMYMFASGDASKAITGKRTLSHAFVGLAIVMLSSIIMNAVRIAIIGNKEMVNCAQETCIEAETAFLNLIHWVTRVSGIVAVVFVLLGGISYITSSGDAGKLKQAKNTILYALIGLAIVALAEIITAFVSNLIRSSRDISFDTTTTISKEVHEKIY